MSERGRMETARMQLRRLATLTDVVYAVSIVLVVQWLPLPDETGLGGDLWIGELLVEFIGNVGSAALAMIFIIVYWIRSNTLLSACDHTDGIHTASTIVGVFCVLLLLYVVRVSSEVVAPSRRAGESFAVALIGIAGGIGWYRARKRGLVREGITNEEKVGVQVEAFTEPLTAVLTIPLAYVGDLAWNLGWLVYFPLAALLRRRGHSQGL